MSVRLREYTEQRNGRERTSAATCGSVMSSSVGRSRLSHRGHSFASCNRSTEANGTRVKGQARMAREERSGPECHKQPAGRGSNQHTEDTRQSRRGMKGHLVLFVEQVLRVEVLVRPLPGLPSKQRKTRWIGKGKLELDAGDKGPAWLAGTDSSIATTRRKAAAHTTRKRTGD